MTVGEPVTWILELVGNTDVVNPGIDVSVELHFLARVYYFHFSSRVDVHVPDTGVESPVLTEGNIYTGRSGQAEGIIQVQLDGTELIFDVTFDIFRRRWCSSGPGQHRAANRCCHRGDTTGHSMSEAGAW